MITVTVSLFSELAYVLQDVSLNWFGFQYQKDNLLQKISLSIEGSLFLCEIKHRFGPNGIFLLISCASQV